MKQLKELNPLLHSQLRLSIISLLINVREAEFTYLKEKTNSTAGNLSIQITKLQDAGYVAVEKMFRDNRPLTKCKITKEGKNAFKEYINNLKDYLTIK